MLHDSACAVPQGLSQQGAANGAALSQLWAGLAPAVPLWSLSLSLAYYDSGLGMAAAACHSAALRRGAGGLPRYSQYVVPSALGA